MLSELTSEVVELALRSTALEPVVLNGAAARGIVAAIFKSLEAVEQALRDIRHADDPDNPAHLRCRSFQQLHAQSPIGDLPNGKWSDRENQLRVVFTPPLSASCARGSGGPSRLCPFAHCARLQAHRARRPW